MFELVNENGDSLFEWKPMYLMNVGDKFRNEKEIHEVEKKIKQGGAWIITTKKVV